MEGVISYLRTAAEIKSLLALGIAKVLSLLRSSKVRVALRPLLYHLLKEQRTDPNHLDQIGAKLSDWQDERRARDHPPVALVYHHSGARALHGFFYRRVSFVKKPDRKQYRTEREAEFSRVRVVWLKQIAASHRDELLEAGIPASKIDEMALFGKAPKRYQVHHRIPLDDGGTNDYANLILIRDDVEHRAVHGYYNPGELRIRLLRPGQRADVMLPVPPDDTIVYPAPAQGYVCERIPNATLVELFDV